jgi:signal transduction histidine kinase
MKKLRRWISARLWRRLAFSHFAIIFTLLLVLQLAVALLVAFFVRGTAPIEGDAGRLAFQIAHSVGWLIETGREAEVPLALEMLQQGALLPPDVESPAAVPEFNIQTGSEPVERLVAVTVLDESGTVTVVSGEATAQAEDRTAWEEIAELALAGETNPYKLSRWVRLKEGGLLLGSAAITRTDGEVSGAVVVEMYPSLRLETSGGAAPLVGFVSILLVTALLGLPALLLAILVAGISGIIVSRSLGRRLSPLEHTARKMADGDLTLRLADTSPDEIGRVGQAFNEMAEQLERSQGALKAEKEQVETLLRARRDLVANISHDLRTPIASLSAHLETLSEHPDRLDEYLPILSDESARISGLIADLFELSRLDAHELKLDLAAVDLADLIARTVASYKQMAWEQRRIVLETHLSDPLPPVQADVQRVEQILANLITNGLRFTPEGGIITIEAEALPEDVEVRVSDTGIGIPLEDLPLIFERSYRGDRSRARSDAEDRLSSGSGLGLAIVKGLVESMGGSVGATSAQGEGTCISFRLPLALPTPTV